MEKKIERIVELKIEEDDIIFDTLGLEVVSLVEQPAIEVGWKSFQKETFVEKTAGETKDEFIDRCMSVMVGDEAYENDQAYAICINKWESFEKVELQSFNDYPEDVKNNARKVLEWTEKNGWGSCGTDVGKQRANQLAKGENISLDTIKRMYSYLSRHEVDLETSTTYNDGCGKLMYDAWGGKAALRWSKSKLKELGEIEAEEVELKDIKHGEYTFTIDQQKEVLKAAEELGETINVDDMYFTLSKENFSITITDILKGLSVISSLTTNQAANDEGEVFYRYAGPPAERNFCKALQRLNKVFTRQDINDMESRGVNRDFGHQGQPYSIWEYSGGSFCKHYWREVLIFRGSNNNKVIIDKGAATTAPNDRAKKGVHPSNPIYAGLSKHEFSINEDKRIVVGPLLIPNKFIERIDESGNPYYVFFSKETIKKIAEKFFRENKHNNTDINHDEDITNKNTLLESWIVEDSVFDKSHIYGFNLPKGTWMGSYKINDEKTWELVKQKKLTGFSIAGFFLEQNGKERKAEMDLQKIINLLNEVEGE